MAGRRDETTQRTRVAIIDAGIRLMYERGYDAASTSAIARAAGVSPATLFNYFPSKVSIVFADDHLWAPPADAVPQSSPRRTLRHALALMLDNPEWTRGTDDPLTAMRFDLVRREPQLTAYQSGRLLQLAPALAALLTTAHGDLAAAEALALSGALTGAIAATLSHADHADVADLVDLRQAILTAADVALDLPRRSGRPPC